MSQHSEDAVATITGGRTALGDAVNISGIFLAAISYALFELCID